MSSQNPLPVNKNEMGRNTHTEVVGDVSMSTRFRAGVSRHIRAKRRESQLEAEIQALLVDKQRLEYENSHDDLTGALNKKAFLVKVDERIKEAKPFGVLFLDMDAFKAVNDRLGHGKGDEVLKAFGEHMRAHFRRKGEVIAHAYFREAHEDELQLGRYGGDEFGILVNLSNRGHADDSSVEQRMEAAEAYAQHVTQEFVVLQDESVRALDFGVSLGGAIWRPEDPVLTSALIHQADQAMYKDKVSNGRPARS